MSGMRSGNTVLRCASTVTKRHHSMRIRNWKKNRSALIDCIHDIYVHSIICQKHFNVAPVKEKKITPYKPSLLLI